MVVKQVFIHNNSKERMDGMMRNICQNDWDNRTSEERSSATEEKGSESMKCALQGLASQSNVHGISFLAGDKSVPIKTLWAIAFLSLFGFATYQLYTIMTLYYSYPVKTKVKMEFKPLPFPAITICNMNTIRKSKVNSIESTILQQIFNGSYSAWTQSSSTTYLQQASTTTPYVNYGTTTPYQRRRRSVDKRSTTGDDSSGSGDENSGSGSDSSGSGDDGSGSGYDSSGSGDYYYATTLGYDDYGSGYYYDDPSTMTSYLKDYMLDPYTSPLPETIEYEKFKEEYLKIDRKDKKIVGHQLKHMLMACTYNGRNCNANIKDIVTYEYGNCFTIQSPAFIAGSTGPRSGMVLTINLENHEAIEELTEGYGMRLVIHEPRSFPLPMEEGMTISGGYETSIGLKMTRIERKGKPYGTCIDPKVYFMTYGIRYSTQACIQQCWEKQADDTCGCKVGLVQTEINRFHDNTEQNNDTILGCFTEDTRKCSIDVRRELLNEVDTYCDCPQPCLENTYSTTFSGRIWPHNTKLKELTKQACTNYNFTDGTPCELETYSGKEHNFLKVNIYYEDLNYEVITEEPLYDATQLISDVGGSMGLCLGASLLCICEVFEAVVMVLFVLVKKLRGDNAVHGIHLTQNEEMKSSKK